jgi:hypothetical protein
VARDRVAAAELHALWVASMEHEAQISTQVLAQI